MEEKRGSGSGGDGGSSGDSKKLPPKKRSWLRIIPPIPKEDHENHDHEQRETRDFDLNELPNNDKEEADRKGKRPLIMSESSSSSFTIPPLKKSKKALVMTSSSSMTKKILPSYNPNSSDIASSSSSPSTSSDNEVDWLLRDIMRLEKYASMSDKKLILKKEVTQSDILKRQTRIALPYGLILTEFLTDYEKELVKEKDEKGKLKNINVTLIGGLSMSEYQFKLCRWLYKNRRGYRYALKSRHLSQFIVDNDLDIGDIIRVVSFRLNGVLYLLVVKDPQKKTS